MTSTLRTISPDCLQLINRYCSALAARHRYLSLPTRRRGAARLSARGPSRRRREQLDRSVDEAARLIDDGDSRDDRDRPLRLVDGSCLETALAQLADMSAVRASDPIVAMVLDLRRTISEARIARARSGVADVSACTAQLESLGQALRRADLDGVERLGPWTLSDDRVTA